MLKVINFVSFVNTFGWNQIGGTDSYMRRFSLGLIKAEYQVNWLFYGKKKDVYSPINKLKIYNFDSFNSLLKHVEKSNQPIVICYLKPIDRLKLIFFSFKNSIKNLYYLSFFFPDTIIKKIIKFLEIKLTGYRLIFCVSKRILSFTKKIKSDAIFLPPIIPHKFFSIGKGKIEKNNFYNTNINVSFIGRLDPRKGIYDFINLVKKNKNKNINWFISGIYITNDIKKTTILQSLKKKQK